jgi:hypothetical protein
MNSNTTTRGAVSNAVRNAVGSVRRHPVRAAAICVPLLAVSVFTSQSMASATPTPTLAVSSAAASAPSAQHVMLFDNDMSGQKVTGMNSKAPVKEPANVDGCDADYGTPGQCVPWTIPASTPAAACTWLRSMGFGPLKVVGTNRQHLPVVNGYACPEGS